MTRAKNTPGPVPQLSWIVPMYRTSAHLDELLDRIGATSAVMGLSHEVILINDACPEGGAAADDAASVRPAVSVVHHAHNQGQDAAIRSGLRLCRADWAVAIDADLQDPPEAVLRLWTAREAGIDAAFANRVGLYTSPGRRITSMVYRRLASLLAGLPTGACLFLLMNRRLIDRVAATTGGRISILAVVAAARGRWATVPITRNARPSGRSAYSGLRRLDKALVSLWQILRSRRFSKTL